MSARAFDQIPALDGTNVATNDYAVPVVEKNAVIRQPVYIEASNKQDDYAQRCRRKYLWAAIIFGLLFLLTNLGWGIWLAIRMINNGGYFD